MSRIYFNSPSETSEVRGSERAHFGVLVRDIGNAILKPEWNLDLLRTAVPAGHYLSALAFKNDGAWAAAFSTALGVGDFDLNLNGKPVEAFALNLNTVLTVGNDAMKLAARIHGACEIHAWVTGANRGWLAGIIDQGISSGIFREGQGWNDVTAMLRLRDDEPVVTSFSVTDSFPNTQCTNEWPAWPVGVPERWDALTDAQQQQRGALEEAWHELEPAEQWRQGDEWLRSQGAGLEIAPDNWESFRFVHRLDAIQFLNQLHEPAKAASRG